MAHPWSSGPLFIGQSFNASCIIPPLCQLLCSTSIMALSPFSPYPYIHPQGFSSSSSSSSSSSLVILILSSLLSHPCLIILVMSSSSSCHPHHHVILIIMSSSLSCHPHCPVILIFLIIPSSSSSHHPHHPIILLHYISFFLSYHSWSLSSFSPLLTFPASLSAYQSLTLLPCPSPSFDSS